MLHNEHGTFDTRLDKRKSFGKQIRDGKSKIEKSSAGMWLGEHGDKELVMLIPKTEGPVVGEQLARAPG